MNKPKNVAVVGRLFLLVLLLFLLYALDFRNLALAPVVAAAPLPLFLMAVIDGLLMAFAISRTQLTGWRLVAAVGLLYFGLKTLLVAVEGIYLPDVLTPDLVASLLVNGATTAVIAVPVAVWLLGRRTADLPPRERAFGRPTLLGLVWRLPLVGLLWVVLFVATGLLVFRPVATALDAATAEAYLNAFNPENPLLVLGFQLGRGMLWALLALPLLWALARSRSARGLVLGLLFAGWMGSSLLLPNDLLPAQIWLAHLLEVLMENFLFGFVVAGLLVGASVAKRRAGVTAEPRRRASH